VCRNHVGRRQHGGTGDVIGRCECGHVATGAGEEFCAEHLADVDHAGDDHSVAVETDAVVDGLVDLGELRIEFQYREGQPGDQDRGYVLAVAPGVLGRRCGLVSTAGTSEFAATAPDPASL
jgi:hypothetical protein